MISVCLASYNGEAYIGQQIQSILMQLGAHDELIISDDGSTDGTLEIISVFGDSRIRLVHHVKRPVKNSFFYTSLNFENALQHAKGEYIFLADQDDVWNKNKIEQCMVYLKEYDLVLHDCRVVDKDLNVIHESYFELQNSRKGIVLNLLKNSYLGCCMAFRRKVVDKAFPLRKREVPHDIWIGLISELNFKVKFIKQALVDYRRHDNNLSASSEKSKNSLYYKISYRLTLLTQLINL